MGEQYDVDVLDGQPTDAVTRIGSWDLDALLAGKVDTFGTTEPSD